MPGPGAALSRERTLPCLHMTKISTFDMAQAQERPPGSPSAPSGLPRAPGRPAPPTGARPLRNGYFHEKLNVDWVFTSEGRRSPFVFSLVHYGFGSGTLFCSSLRCRVSRFETARRGSGRERIEDRSTGRDACRFVSSSLFCVARSISYRDVSSLSL